jgi:CheY-like chemotaxis protein
MKLMIVEDNDQMRRFIRSLFARLADAIHECSDGSEAVAAYAAHHFMSADWVLMDVEMKEMDATRKIKEAFADANIMIVTQHDDVRLRAAALDAGAADYVLKENLATVRWILQTRGH